MEHEFFFPRNPHPFFRLGHVFPPLVGIMSVVVPSWEMDWLEGIPPRFFCLDILDIIYIFNFKKYINI